ncbi:MAG: hypothetical protein K0R34_759 [Herbinix sp.]|jgi:hypothetical protein|nr:hypothetical protein [Herbinix sp.]
MNWINIFGLSVVILMLLPNLIYAIKTKTFENKCKNKAMNLLEQIGRYGSMFFMVFNIGLYEFGFRSNAEFVIWLIVTILLLLLYWLFWFIFFRSPHNTLPMLLAILPSAIFIITGLFLQHWLLLISGILFSIGHIYVTYQNNQANHNN